MAQFMNASVLAQLEDAAPQVLSPSYDVHLAVVKALAMWASANPLAGKDVNSTSYWYCSLQELAPLTGMQPTMIAMGSCCRHFCLVMRREGDGWHVAFGEKQLEILRREFGLGAK
jgi:hypothetical protein